MVLNQSGGVVAAVFWYSEDGAICLSMHCIHESVYVQPAAFAAALCRKIVFCQCCSTRPGAAGTNRCAFYINLLLLKANKAEGEKKRSMWFNSKCGSCCEETAWWSRLLIRESALPHILSMNTYFRAGRERRTGPDYRRMLRDAHF